MSNLIERWGDAFLRTQVIEVTLGLMIIYGKGVYSVILTRRGDALRVPREVSRWGETLLAICIASAITHPILWLAGLWLSHLYKNLNGFGADVPLFYVVCGEVAVILIEASWYRATLIRHAEARWRDAIIFSAVLNTASAMYGVMSG